MYDESLSVLNKIIENDYNDSSVFSLMSTVYKNKEMYDDALKFIDLALNINSDDIVLKLKKCMLLAYVDEFEFSLQGFDEISKADFDCYAVIELYYNYYGEALEVMEKYDEAIKLYDEYLEKYPNFPKENIKIAKEDVLKLIK